MIKKTAETARVAKAEKKYRGKDRQELQALLRDHGFYSTEGRLRLLSYLKRSRAPRSVPDIAAHVGQSLDEANVYRSLEALSAKGICIRTDLRRGGAHYEFAHGHHHHIVCNTCGATEDIEGCVDKPLERKALRDSRRFFTIETHALEFFGTCRTCARV